MTNAHAQGRDPALKAWGAPSPAQVDVAPGAHVLAKPFGSNELLTRVREVLDAEAAPLARTASTG